MQKRILLLVMLLMVFCMCSCDSADGDSDVKVNTSKSNENDSRDENEKVLDAEIETTAPPVVEEIKSVEEINREILVNSEFHDYLFQIGDVLYDYRDEQLLQKLMDNGFELKGGMGYIGEYGSSIELNNNELGVTCKINIYSSTEEPTKYTEGIITSVQFEPRYNYGSGIGSSNDNVYFFKAIHTGMSKEELEEIMGEPTRQKLEEYTEINFTSVNTVTELKYEYVFYTGYADEINSGEKDNYYDHCFFYFNGDDILTSIALYYTTLNLNFEYYKQFGQEWIFVPAETIEVLHDID